MTDEEKIKKLQEMREKVAKKVDELCKLIDKSEEDRLSSTKFAICRLIDVGTFNYYEALGLLTDVQYAQKDWIDREEEREEQGLCPECEENHCAVCGDPIEPGHEYIPEENEDEPGDSPFTKGMGKDQ